MSIAPKYNDWSTAPMSYFKFLRVVSILWVFVTCGRGFMFYSEGNTIGIVEQCVILVAQIVVAIGLNKKKWYGVQALFLLYILIILDYLLAIGIYAYHDILDSSIVAQVLGSIIGTLIYAIPTYIYFKKRKPLFLPNTAEDISSLADVSTSMDPQVPPDENSEIPTVAPHRPQIKYCRKCGYKLLDNSLYCSNCGSPVRME